MSFHIPLFPGEKGIVEGAEMIVPEMSSQGTRSLAGGREFGGGGGKRGKVFLANGIRRRGDDGVDANEVFVFLRGLGLGRGSA